MLSKLILLLGTLIAAFIAYSCIQQNKDILTTEAVPKEALSAQPSIPEAVGETESISSQTAVSLKNPSFRYTNTPEEMLQFTGSVEDQTDTFTEKINRYCKESLCKKSLHFDKETLQAPWKEQIFALIDFIRSNNIKEAAVQIENETISFRGTLSDDLQKDALEKILSGFTEKGLHEDLYITIIPPKESTPALSEPQNGQEAANRAEKSVTVKPAKPAEEPQPQTEKQPSLEDVQKSRIETTQANINALLKTHPIYFRRNSNELTLSSKKILDKIIDLVNKNTEEIERLRISGHTDASGSAAYNKILSQKRAEKVREYLIQKHINVPVLEAIGYGEEKPVTNNPYAKENRRVEIEIRKEANDE